MSHPERFNNPAFVFCRDGRKATLKEQLVYRHPLKTIIVPAGFETDFASVPRAFWRIVPPWDSHLLASVVHDRLYDLGEGSQAVADAIFLDAMTDLGVPKWKRVVMYIALRFFGFAAWNEHRARDGKTE